MLDYTIHVDRYASPRAVDFGIIDSDVLKALRYLRGANYAVDTPKLRQVVGVHVSDDVTPLSLHREVSLSRGHKCPSILSPRDSS